MITDAKLGSHEEPTPYKQVSTKYWINTIDPRVRICLVVAFAVVVVSLQTIHILMLALCVALLMLFCSSLTWAKIWHKVLAMDAFILAMLLMLPFTVSGDVWFTVVGYQASWQGLQQAIIIALKANGVMVSLLTLVGSMESVMLGQALGKMKVPANLVHLMLFTVRYIEVLQDEYVRLRQAMKARAFKAGNNWHTYRSIGYLFGIMLVRSVERSERVMEAMKCRGFRGQLPLLVQWQIGKADVIFALLMLFVMAVLLLLEQSHAFV